MPQPARALAGAACALVLSTTAAADSIRGELGPALSTYDQAKKTLEALEATDIATARVQGLQDMMYDGTEKRPTVTLRIDSVKDGKKTETSLREGVDFNGHRGNGFRDSSGRLGERNYRHDSRPCTHKLPH